MIFHYTSQMIRGLPSSGGNHPQAESSWPNTRAQASRCTCDLRVPPTWFPDGSEEPPRKWAPVVTEPVGEEHACLHELSKAACESAAFYLPPPWTWVPTPIPTGRKQLQAWLHAIWHEGNRMEKRSTGTKSALHDPDSRPELCHILWSPGPADSGQSPWQRPSQGS